MKIIDNFLPDHYFKQIENLLMGQSLSWYWNDGILNHTSNSGFAYSFVASDLYQFVHILYNVDRGGINSNYYPLFDIVQKKLGVKRLDRIKINLNPKTVFHRKSGFHTDQRSVSEGFGLHQKTAVFYINTNNGWTEFKKGGKVKNITNRMVIFDSNLEHTGVTCTDEKRRVVINFNYDI